MTTENELQPLFRRKLPYVVKNVVDGIAPADFDAIFNGYIQSTQKKWGHDRTKTVGGSEVFGCIRKAWYSRHGTQKDADYRESWGATRRGDLIENYHVVPAMEWGAANLGFKIDYTGADQQTLFIDGLPMSVTPDGLIHDIPRNWLERYGIPDIKSDCVMFEIKSIDPRVDLSEEKSIHHGQVQIQMGMVRESTKFKPHYAVIYYVNASFFDDTSVFIVEWDPKKYEIAKKRAHAVYETKSDDMLMREGRVDGSCQYCPYTATCLQTMVDSFPPELSKDEEKRRKKEGMNPVLIAKLESVMDRAHKSRAAVKKVEKDDALIKEELKAILREFGERRAKDGNWSLAYSLQPGRKTLDKERLEIAFVEMQRIIEEAGLANEIDEVLRKIGVGREGQNELIRIDDMDTWMKAGDPFEVLRMTFTEPDSDEL